MLKISKQQMETINQSTQGTGGATLACTSEISPCPPTTVATKPEDIKNHLKEGDIVLRMGPEGESNLIAEATRTNYSHAGIVVMNDKGEPMIVDAYPDRDDGAVKAITPESFFGEGHAVSGGVFRHKDSAAATSAAQWANQQTKDPDYKFELFSPWNEDKKSVYCSDFVYQAYSNAGKTLVERKYDLLSDQNIENTVTALRKHGGFKAKLASDQKIEERAREMAESGEFIAPGQLAESPDVCPAVDFKPNKGKYKK